MTDAGAVATSTEGNGSRTMRRGRRAHAEGDGTARRGFVLAPAGRRVRFPELAVGVLVMALFALGVVLWHLGSVDRVPALALANPVGRGEVVDVEDLRIVNVSADHGVARLDASASDRIVGRVALIDLPAGAMVTEGIVADSDAVGPDDGVVGLSLEPGQYPTADLTVGDHVNVMAGRNGAPQPPANPTAVARDAEVVAVEDLSAERKLVSLKTTEAEAETVAAVDNSTLRLVLVAAP